MYNTLDVTLEASLKVNKHHGGSILKQSTAGYPSLTYALAHTQTHNLWTYFELMQCFPLSSPSCQYSWLRRFSKLNLLINTVLVTCVTSLCSYQVHSPSQPGGAQRSQSAVKFFFVCVCSVLMQAKELSVSQQAYIHVWLSIRLLESDNSFTTHLRTKASCILQIQVCPCRGHTQPQIQQADVAQNTAAIAPAGSLLFLADSAPKSTIKGCIVLFKSKIHSKVWIHFDR